MTLLQRYIWRQALWPLLIALTSLSVLALLTQSLSTIDLIVENRQSAFIFFKVTLLALPQLIAIILPLAVFMAVIYSINRLNIDSELVVAKATGVSPSQIANPIMRLAVMAAIAHLILNLFLQPLSFRDMRETLLQVRTDIAAQMLRPGEFITPTPRLTLYASEVRPNGRMVDVLIHDSRDMEEERTHTAKEGYLFQRNDKTLLALSKGNIQVLAPNGSMDLVQFDKHVIDLSAVMAMDPVLRLKTSDRFLHELLKPSPKESANPAFFKKLIAEGHARLSAPIYNIALALLAIATLTTGAHQRLGYGRKIIACIIFGFTVRLAGFSITSASEANTAINPLQYGLPLTLCVFSLCFIIRRKRKPTLGASKRSQNYRELVEASA